MSSYTAERRPTAEPGSCSILASWLLPGHYAARAAGWIGSHAREQHAGRTADPNS